LSWVPPGVPKPRDICLKPGSLNLHPTHLLKSQLVLQEVNGVLRRFMSSSKGTRGKNQGSIYHRALLPQRFLWRKWLMPHHFTIHHLVSSLQFYFSPLPKIILNFVVIVVGDYFL
uniref:Uncharacterized protein n=1 Tax=Spermophilus dauricus TaxID=99837 RepID=A0A8C9QIQ4_SPEDA